KMESKQKIYDRMKKDLKAITSNDSSFDLTKKRKAQLILDRWKTIMDDFMRGYDRVMVKIMKSDCQRVFKEDWKRRLEQKQDEGATDQSDLQNELSKRAFIIIVKAFDDLVGKINFNSRRCMETLAKHDGILTAVHVNAKSMEVGFMEVVGNAIIVDLKKQAEDKEKLFKVMQVSIFYQCQHHQERGATEDQILNIQLWHFSISMHRTNGGLHITNVMENFTIPDNVDQAYVLEEIVNKVYFFKSRLMDYYIALQEVSRKTQSYKVSSEHPLNASPSKRRSQKY
ncbi:10985_t:CDS:2, partial [Paraglomus occultum]